MATLEEINVHVEGGWQYETRGNKRFFNVRVTEPGNSQVICEVRIPDHVFLDLLASYHPGYEQTPSRLKRWTS